MSEANYRPNGQIQGNTKDLPDRGTSTGLNGDTYGADIGADATNRVGRMTDCTKSDPAEMDKATSKGLKR
jgi:hypothetical protein